MADKKIVDVGSDWRGRIWRYLPVLLVVLIILIFSNSAASLQNSSRFVGPFLVWLFPDFEATSIYSIHFAIRKTAHLLEYAVLGFFLARAFTGSSYSFLNKRVVLATLFSVIAVAAVDETNQALNPTRTGSPVDVGIDAVGGLLGIAFLRCFACFKTRFGGSRKKG